MKSSFDHITNSRLYRIGDAVGNVVIISALFLVFCIPVVTIGASVSALYYTVYRKFYKRSDTPSKDFMHSFKMNLKNGIIINLIYLIYSAVVGFNIYFAFNGLGDVKLPDWYLIISFLPLLPVIFTLPFVYPLLSRFNNGIKGTITNSLTLCMINFPKFLLIWLITLASLAISIVFPPSALITPLAATYLCQMITEKAFAAAVRVEKAREEKDMEEDISGEESNEDTDITGSNEEEEITG